MITPVGIGADSLVGAGALVRDDVPPSSGVGGLAARRLRRLGPQPAPE